MVADGNPTCLSPFVVHQRLLCLQSRWFNSKLRRPQDEDILAEVVAFVEQHQNVEDLFDIRESNPILQQEDVPSGYIPSWMAYARNYREQLKNLPLDDTNENYKERVFSLPKEAPYPFGLLIHFLYLQKLITFDQCHSEDFMCTLQYALAERLEVPLLRQQCYSNIRERYRSPSSLPKPDIVELLVGQCSPQSQIWRFFVLQFAHAIISKTIDEDNNAVLNLHPTVSTDVAREIMSQIQGGQESKPPYKEDFNVDDSDSDFDASGYGSGPDSDDMVDISDDEETDSLFPGDEEPRMRPFCASVTEKMAGLKVDEESEDKKAAE
ncbi:MAG: hypothetical protein MMC33_004497 [Icmadophila ericetorum]|nr:hypothetical protein [Icmadophila ericetorum]